MPTLLACCSIPWDSGNNIRPGASLLPLLTAEEPAAGSALSDRPLVVYDEYGPVRMVRTKEWKYIHRYPYGPHELYHMILDPEERSNLYGKEEFGDIVRHMRGQLESWFLAYADPAADGRAEPVSGRGQKGLAGRKANGANSYVPL
jgi:arylsulfatase A-like enzyme